VTTLLKYRGYEGTAELDLERGVCRGKLLFIDDLVTYESEKPAGLVAEFHAAVDDYLETCAELGREPKKPFSGMFNVRVSPALHKAAAVKAAQHHITLNAVVVAALGAYLSPELNRAEPVTAKGTDVLVFETFGEQISQSFANTAPHFVVIDTDTVSITTAAVVESSH
jgi:predicted HicB family RNase H-like nuclease